MKRVLSLLIALITAIGISSAAFAATDDVFNFGHTSTSEHITGRAEWGLGGSGLEIKNNEILIVDRNNRVITPEYNLKPGEEYEFRIFKATGDQSMVDPSHVTMTRVTGADLGGGKFRLRGVRGTSVISNARIEQRGSGNTATYTMKLTARENWGTRQTDVEYSLSVIDQTAAAPIDFAPGVLTFTAGYGQFTDDMIDSFSEGDIITISNDRPIILRRQFTEIAKNYNYRNVEFEAENGSWRYIGRVSGMGDTNFTYTQNAIPVIMNKFLEQDFKFLTFGAGVNFPTNGEMRIDVSDISGDFNRLYTYLFRNGRLTPVNTTYDAGTDEIIFRTNYLGSFVMTDVEITDLDILEQVVPTPPVETIPPTVEPEHPATHNPGTGATAGVAIATTLGLVSLATAGAVTRKKK